MTNHRISFFLGMIFFLVLASGLPAEARTFEEVSIEFFGRAQPDIVRNAGGEVHEVKGSSLRGAVPVRKISSLQNNPAVSSVHPAGGGPGNLSEGLVHHIPFDSLSSDQDRVGNAQLDLPPGPALVSGGVVGPAIDTEATIMKVTDLNLNLNTDFTISIWVKPDPGNTGYEFLGYDPSGPLVTPGVIIRINIFNNRRFRVDFGYKTRLGANPDYFCVLNNIPPLHLDQIIKNRWNQLTISMNRARNQRTTTLRTYINGRLMARDTDSCPYSDTLFQLNHLLIGKIPAQVGRNTFDGKIDELLFYRRSLSPADARRLYQNPGVLR